MRIFDCMLVGVPAAHAVQGSTVYDSFSMTFQNDKAKGIEN